MPVDFSPLYAPVPESPTSRGLTSVGTALDAVLARRQQRDLMEQQIEERKLSREMMDSTRRYTAEMGNERANADRKQRASQARQTLDYKNRSLQFRQTAEGIKLHGFIGEQIAKGLMSEDEGEDYMQRNVDRWTTGQPQQPAQPQQPSASPSPGNQPQTQGTPGQPAPQLPPPPSPSPPPAPGPAPGVASTTSAKPLAFAPGFVGSLPLAYDPLSAVMAAKSAAGVAHPAQPELPLPAGSPPATPGPAPAPTMAPTVGTPATAAAAPRPSRFANVTPAAVADAFEKGLLATPEVMADPRLQDEVRATAALGRKPNGLGRDEMASLYNAAKNRIQSGKNAALANVRAEHTSQNQEKTQGRQDLQGYLDQKHYKMDQASLRQFQRMLNQAELAKRGNSKAAAVFMGMFVKFAQGEVGVLTPGDIHTFWTTAGSPKERTESYLAKAFNGGLGESARTKAVEAVEWLKKTSNDRINDIYTGAVDLMRGYGADGDRRLRAYFGRGLPEMEATRKQGLDEAEVARFKASLGKPGK